jgi:aspartate carbamoyltransferase catalytic subunit
MMRSAGIRVTETDQLEASIGKVDIAYSTRIQEERFSSKAEADVYRGKFRLNQQVYTQYCEPNTVIMHPLPRDSRAEANELDNDLNENPNLAIFRQADNGVLIRMALVCAGVGCGGVGGQTRAGCALVSRAISSERKNKKLADDGVVAPVCVEGY